MKRIILLGLAVLLLAGCGLEQAAENTTASVGTSNEKGDGNSASVVTEEITFDSVKCNVHPLIDSRNQASVTCLLNIDKDSLKLGSDDPVNLYLGGSLNVLADDDYLKPFRDDESLTAVGKGRFNICKGEGKVQNGLFYPCGLPFIILTAQIDGIRVPVEIVGAATTAGAKEMNILTNNENITSTLVGMQCEGRMIPDSSLAQIIMIGELKDGREVFGGGIIETGILAAGNSIPLIAGCDMEDETANVYLGGALGDENSTVNAFPLSFEEIKVTLKIDDGDSVVEKSATVSGFVMGMGGLPD